MYSVRLHMRQSWGFWDGRPWESRGGHGDCGVYMEYYHILRPQTPVIVMQFGLPAEGLDPPLGPLGTRVKPGNAPRKLVSKGLTGMTEWVQSCRYVGRKEEIRMKCKDWRRRVNGKTPIYGRRRERRWTPTRTEAQDTRASPIA